MENDIYSAGLIDGEGSILLSRMHKDESRRPVVSVSSTTYGLLKFLCDTYGGNISNHKTYKKHHKQSWSSKISGDKAIACMQCILPYMKEPEKIRRAKLIVDKYKSVTPRNGKYSKDLLKKKQKFEQKFFINASHLYEMKE
jgi:hypothetical protein